LTAVQVFLGKKLNNFIKTIKQDLTDKKWRGGSSQKQEARSQ
jgi:hypothetical protein